MRRQPRQARSRLMVERIVAAGREVLVTEGYDAFSTNRVATVAAVSPGSLYQYFPDKASIVDVVIDRYWDEVAEQVAASLANHIGAISESRNEQVADQIVRQIADALLTALESDAGLLRLVTEELPIARNRDRRGQLEQRVRELMAAYLAARPDASRRPDPATSAWVLVLAMENLATRWVLDKPPIARAQLLDEIVALTNGYLLRPAR